MCGIIGVAENFDENKIISMADKLKHRGELKRISGIEGISFAHVGKNHKSKRHIACSDDKSICAICSSEIYNSEQLANQFENIKLSAPISDAELILRLYAEYGDEFVYMLDGVFAIAIYDKSRGVILARDPIGIKPLYMGSKNGIMFFASEIKALIGNVDYFDEFPAGCIFTPENGMRKYFDLSYSGDEISDIDDAIIDIRMRLDKAVSKRLLSDSAAGVFLSGGLDSSIIASIASKKMKRLNTYSIGMEDSEDLVAAKLCSKYLNTNHHEVKYTTDDILAVLPKVIYHLESYDTALIRSSIPNYILSERASKDVKSILTGEGADELFGGYHYLKDLDKDDQYNELTEITLGLHNTGLQRCDRMAAAHGLESKTPFLDIDLVKYAFTVPVDMKIGADDTEKYILRQAYKYDLPKELIYRKKRKFSEGSGSMYILADLAENMISDSEFEKEADKPISKTLKSKEDLLYYRIFNKYFDDESAERSVGFTQNA